MCSDSAAALRWMVSRGRSCQYKPPHPIPMPTLTHFPIPNSQCFNAPMPQCPIPNSQFIIHKPQCPKAQSLIHNSQYTIPQAHCPMPQCPNAQTHIFSLDFHTSVGQKLSTAYLLKFPMLKRNACLGTHHQKLFPNNSVPSVAGS